MCRGSCGEAETYTLLHYLVKITVTAEVLFTKAQSERNTFNALSIVLMFFPSGATKNTTTVLSV